jgi:hypothetical protein
VQGQDPQLGAEAVPALGGLAARDANRDRKIA